MDRTVQGTYSVIKAIVKKKKMSYMPANWRVLPGSVLKCQPARGVYVDTAKHKTSDDDSGLNL